MKTTQLINGIVLLSALSTLSLVGMEGVAQDQPSWKERFTTIFKKKPAVQTPIEKPYITTTAEEDFTNALAKLKTTKELIQVVESKQAPSIDNKKYKIDRLQELLNELKTVVNKFGVALSKSGERSSTAQQFQKSLDAGLLLINDLSVNKRIPRAAPAKLQIQSFLKQYPTLCKNKEYPTISYCTLAPLLNYALEKIQKLAEQQ